MPNDKAAQRHRVVVEFGVLIQPFRELRERTTPPDDVDYRIAVAKVRAGDPAWRQHVREFTTFAPDVKFEQEYQDVSHVLERLWRKVNTLLESRQFPSEEDRHRAFIGSLVLAEQEFQELIARVPVEWEPIIFAANTPFTSYLQILEATDLARRRLHYFDRHLKPEFFDLFLRSVPRGLEVRLVTTAEGVKLVKSVSSLVTAEFTNYQLIELHQRDFHDRNLRVDDRVFSLGPGVDRAGVALTNFGPADASDEAHMRLDSLIALGAIVHGS